MRWRNRHTGTRAHWVMVVWGPTTTVATPPTAQRTCAVSPNDDRARGLARQCGLPNAADAAPQCRVSPSLLAGAFNSAIGLVDVEDVSIHFSVSRLARLQVADVFAVPANKQVVVKETTLNENGFDHYP